MSDEQLSVIIADLPEMKAELLKGMHEFLDTVHAALLLARRQLRESQAGQLGSEFRERKGTMLLNRIIQNRFQNVLGLDGSLVDTIFLGMAPLTQEAFAELHPNLAEKGYRVEE